MRKLSLLRWVAAWGLAVSAVVAAPAHAYPRPGTTTRIDVAPDGSQAAVAPSPSCPMVMTCGARSTISGDGRYVAFISSASNLVPGDTDLGPDVFVRDLRTGLTRLASVSSAGLQQIWARPDLAQIGAVAISADGRYVAFTSTAINLVDGDTNQAADVFVHDMTLRTTTRVDVSSDGKQGAGGGEYLSLSADGRVVAFTSGAATLVPGDTNGVEDVFVHDMRTGRTTRVSVTGQGTEGNGSSGVGVSLDPTGRYIAFGTDASNLVAGDTNNQRDVVFRDLQKGRNELVSVQPDGTPVPALLGNSEVSRGPGWSISRDGRFVLFNSQAATLIPNDTNGRSSDWFVRDRKTHRTERVDVASDGTDRSPGSAGDAAITPDGRYVVFRTSSSLVAQDRGTCPPPIFGTSQGDTDVYVHDRSTGATELISQSSWGAHAYAAAVDAYGGCQTSESGGISDDGARVAFISNATNLVRSDTNQAFDVYVRDRGPELGVGTPTGPPSGPQPPPGPIGCVEGVCVPSCIHDVCTPGLVLSARDREGDVAWPALEESSDIVQARIALRPRQRDLFIEVRLRAMRASGIAGAGLVYGLRLSVAGRQFEVRAVPSLDTSRSARVGVFARDRVTGGYDVVIGSASGGYGTTGQAVVAAVPLHLFGRRVGARLSRVSAFTALGTYSAGAFVRLDTVPLTKVRR